MRFLLIGMLRAYRAVISPLYGQVCRYYPSCCGSSGDSCGWSGSAGVLLR